MHFLSRSCCRLVCALAPFGAMAGGASAQDSEPALVWTPFSQPARQALGDWLSTLAGASFRVEPGPVPERLREALVVHPEVAILVGYASAELEAMQRATGQSALPGVTAVPAHPLDAADRSVLALFADPLVIAVDLDRMMRSFGNRYGDVLPKSLLDLGGGEFEGRFLIESASRSSVSGALFGQVSIARGKRVDEWLAGFGKNTEGALTATSSEAIVRLDRAEDKRFAVVRRSVLEREGGAVGVVLAPDPSPDRSSVILGIAFRRADAASQAVLAALAVEGTSGPHLAAIAAAEGVVALRGSLPEQAPSWCSELRQAVAFEAPRLRAELDAVGDAVDRFQGELKDAIARRQRRFEDVYDVAGMLAVAIVLGAMVLRRRAGNGALEAPR